MSEDGNIPEKEPIKSGAERREHFRVNAEIRLSFQLQSEGGRRPWAYAQDESISPLIGPGDEELAEAQKRLQGQPRRHTNISAGGVRVGFRTGDDTETALQVSPGDPLSVLLELSFPDESGFTLVHMPAWVVWVDETLKWQYVGCQFARIPTRIERIVSQFVMEVERRRLRPK